MRTRIRIEQLSFTTAKATLLNQVDFSVQEGERVALLGNNGSGKSTLFANILGFVSSTQGRIWIDEKDTRTQASLQRVGFVNAQNNLFENLSVRENIRLYCVLCCADFQTVQAKYFKAFDMAPIQHKRAAVLSSGEARRLTLLLACIKEADILLIDEPFTNIDPIYSSDIWQTMTQHKTVLYSTQNWEDIPQHATHIVVLYRGLMLTEKKSVSDFLQRIPHTWKLILPLQEELRCYCERETLLYYTYQQQLMIFCDDARALLNELPQVQQFSVLPKTMGDIYMYVMAAQNAFNYVA